MPASVEMTRIWPAVMTAGHSFEGLAVAGSFPLFSLEISAMSNDAHEATALPDEPALTPEALEELDDLLDELRTRGEEIPQWEFCDGFLTALDRKSTRLNSSH